MKTKFIKTLLLTTVMASSLLLGACSQSQSPSTVSETVEAPTAMKADIESMFAGLSANIVFTDTMEVVTDDYSLILLGIEPGLYTDCVLYMGSGATAEELLIFETSGKAEADSIVEALNTHIEDYKLAFAGYDPEELKILEDAYIISNDSYVICCVCNDAANAKNQIAAYIQ